MMNIENTTPSPELGKNVQLLDFKSPHDGKKDWALFEKGRNSHTCVVNIHGHGSGADQLYTRPDIHDYWYKEIQKRGWSVLCPNVRGSSWMSPSAVSDLHELIRWVQTEQVAEQLVFLAGSMGGTSNLIYGALHPEDIDIMISLCPVSDIQEYYQWLSQAGDGTLQEIRKAIESSYGVKDPGSPTELTPHIARDKVKCMNAPLLVIHGDDDKTIPVQQSKDLADAFGNKNNFTYIEMPGGNHDAPLTHPGIFNFLDGK